MSYGVVVAPYDAPPSTLSMETFMDGQKLANVDDQLALRTLQDHKVNPVNDTLEITVIDKPGAGGASHVYAIGTSYADDNEIVIEFQNGPIAEVGVNGVTHEALLAIVADRLRSFQKGPFACKANACALTHIEEAMHWLQQRTIERMRRGVEGTNAV